MRRKKTFATAALFLAAAVFGRPGPCSADPPPYRRIVSVAPSLTETLFAVGAGDQVAGVTRFCIYPKEAKLKPKIGGYMDPNSEMILALKPDIVLLLHENGGHLENLRRLGLNVKLIDQRTVQAILNSIREIGALTGKEETAQNLEETIRKRMDRLKSKTAGEKPPRVLLAVSHEAALTPPKRVFVPQRRSFFGEMIEMAGGKNVCERNGSHFEMLSQEGMIQLDPDVILDFIPGLRESGISREEMIKQWAKIPGLRASRNGRVHIFDQLHAVVPGPRFIEILEEMSKKIHPEAWKETP